MIESHLCEGKQDIPASGPADLKWGVSITDACVDWHRTVGMLDELDHAVQRRREVLIERGLMRKVDGYKNEASVESLPKSVEQKNNVEL